MANKSRGNLKFALNLGIAIVVNLIFTFLGAPFLRAIRNVYGPRKFWISGIVVSIGLIAVDPGLVLIVALLISQWITIGIYQELEERGKAGLMSATVAIGLGTIAMLVVPTLGSWIFDLHLQETLRSTAEESLKQMLGDKSPADFGINIDFIIGLLPGLLAALQIANLAFALILDGKAARLLGLRYENIASRMRLLDFRLPNFCIWITMVSFLMSFVGVVPEQIKIAAIDVFVVLMTAYLFQGVAIIEYWFLFLRMSAFTKMLIYLLIIGQLFFLLSLVGLIDFWADFRLRIRRWSLSRNNQNNGDSV